MKKSESDQTETSKIFSDKRILLERPEEMNMQEYKALRKVQTVAFKNMLRKSPIKRVAQIMPVRFGYNAH